jgi:hypothetical protein
MPREEFVCGFHCIHQDEDLNGTEIALQCIQLEEHETIVVLRVYEPCVEANGK